MKLIKKIFIITYILGLNLVFAVENSAPHNGHWVGQLEDVKFEICFFEDQSVLLSVNSNKYAFESNIKAENVEVVDDVIVISNIQKSFLYEKYVLVHQKDFSRESLIGFRLFYQDVGLVNYYQIKLSRINSNC